MKLLSKILCLVVISALFLSNAVVAEFDGYFSDTLNHKYREVVKDLSDLGIVEGYKDAEGNLTGEYGPDNTILRAELLKIVLEAGHYGPFPAQDCFTDVKASAWYSGYACRALDLDFVQGYSDGSFKPGKEVSFVEALKMMMITNPPLSMDWDTLEIDSTKDVLADDYWSGANWYEKGVRFASELEIIPTDVTGFDVKFKRGQMAEMYMRLSRAGFGELEDHPGYIPEMNVTFESLAAGINVEEEYWATNGASFDIAAPMTDTERAVTRSFAIFGGGIAEMETGEGYRVTLNLPDGAVNLDQNITLSPLLNVPFEHAISDFKGNGIYLETEYGLTGIDRGWLIFDFSPEERSFDKHKAWDYCRSDFKSFDVMQCLNEKGLGFERDNLFFISFGWDRGTRDIFLVPNYKIADDVYAVEVLEEGVYIPVYLSASEVETLTVQIVDDLSNWDIDLILALAYGMDYYGLTPGSGFEKLLLGLVDQRFYYPDHYLYAMQVLRNFGYNDVALSLEADFQKQYEKEMGYKEKELAKFVATIAAANNSGFANLPSLETDQKLLTALADGIVETDIEQRINSYEVLNEVLKGTGRLSASLVNRLAGWFFPTAYADAWSIDDMWDDARNNINDLIDQTTDFDSLIMLATIAFAWEADDLADKALGKAKQGLAAAIANAAAPSNDDGQICETLSKKTLANYGQNSCGSAMDNLLDLASKAFSIEADDLADQALSKAGLMD